MIIAGTRSIEVEMLYRAMRNAGRRDPLERDCASRDAQQRRMIAERLAGTLARRRLAWSTSRIASRRILHGHGRSRPDGVCRLLLYNLLLDTCFRALIRPKPR